MQFSAHQKLSAMWLFVELCSSLKALDSLSFTSNGFCKFLFYFQGIHSRPWLSCSKTLGPEKNFNVAKA